ncbi:MAG: ABC transporter substrate-binding protein [Ruminococcaceae bacterium]|nr:ABC transporter substrate-binding protein [Oscillospiraceae bacterium]
MKRLTALLLCAILCFSLCACRERAQEDHLEKITFVLDWTPNTNHTGVYVAYALGYYLEEGLAVEIVQPPEDGAPMMVASGRAEYGVSFQEEVAAALTAGETLPITAVSAIIQHNTSGVVSLKDRGIESFADLEGKTYASWGIPIYDEILFDAMRAANGDPTKINIINNTATDTYAALQTDFDAIWIYYGWDGIIGEKKGYELNFLPFAEANPILDYYTPVIIANNAYINENPESVKAFLRATAKGYEYAVEHPEEAAEILAEAVPELDLEVLIESQQYLSKEYIADAPQWGWIDTERWSRFNEWMYEKKMTATSLGANGFTNQYLPQ